MMKIISILLVLSLLLSDALAANADVGILGKQNSPTEKDLTENLKLKYKTDAAKDLKNPRGLQTGDTQKQDNPPPTRNYPRPQTPIKLGKNDNEEFKKEHSVMNENVSKGVPVLNSNGKVDSKSTIDMKAEKPKIELPKGSNVYRDPSGKLRIKKDLNTRNRVPDAGAIKAREEPKDMDKYKSLLAEKVQAKKHRIEANPLNRHKEEILKKVDKEAPARDHATKRMKENTPGTIEYKEIQKIKKEKIEKLINKQQGGLLKKKKVVDIKKAGEPLKMPAGGEKKQDPRTPAGVLDTYSKGEIQAGRVSAGGAGGIGGANAVSELGDRQRPGYPTQRGQGGEVIDRHGRTGGKRHRVPLKKELPDQKLWQKAPLLKRLHRMSPDEELILDVSLSFLTSLQQGVFSDMGPLSTSKKTALINWFHLLSVSLPPEWALHEAIDDLLDNIDYISISDDNLKRMLLKHKLKRSDWSPSCARRRERSGTGFSCGFWKLLHLVSIGVAEHRGGLNLIAADIHPEGSPVFSPDDAADVMYTYIKMFYPCEKCRQNFVATYDQCTNNRRCDRLVDEVDGATDGDWQELGKWLWEVHNDISVRVLGERTERKEKRLNQLTKEEEKRISLPKARDIQVLYPSLESCVACYKDDGTWDDDAVFLFLEKTYWIGFDSGGKADQLLRYDDGMVDIYDENIQFSMLWLAVFIFVAIASCVLQSPKKAILYRKSADGKRSE